MTEEIYSERDDPKEDFPRSCLGLLFLILFLACILFLFGLFGAATGSDDGDGPVSNSGQNTDFENSSDSEASSQQNGDQGDSSPGPIFFGNAPEYFGGLSQLDDLHTAMSCGAEMNYPRPINDHWDVWDLSYYVIQQSGQGSPLSESCQQLANQNKGQDLAEFMSSIGADWWNQSNNQVSRCANLQECANTCSELLGYTYTSIYELNSHLSEEYQSINERPEICIEFQDSLLSEDILNRPSSNSDGSCDAGNLPSAICQQQTISNAQTCANDLGVSDYSSLENLYEQVRDIYAIQLGEIEGSCVTFLEGLLADFPPPSNTQFQIDQAASCLNSPENCPGINATDLLPYQDEIGRCASKFGWNILESPEDEIAFVENLVVSAPWSSQRQWDESCVNLLGSISNDVGGYWELLGRVLASKRGD